MKVSRELKDPPFIVSNAHKYITDIMNKKAKLHFQWNSILIAFHLKSSSRIPTHLVTGCWGPVTKEKVKFH